MKKIYLISSLLLMTLLAGSFSGLFAQTTVRFRQGQLPNAGYTGNVDAMIAEDSPNSNYRNWTTVSVDGENTSDFSGGYSWFLMKYDISSIPAGATITSATLTLQVFNPTGSSGYNGVALNRDWVESQVTWRRWRTGNNWSTNGAWHNPNDYTPGTIVNVGGGTGTRVYNFTAAGIAAVQNWLDNPSSNHGFMLQNRSNTNGFDFYTSERSNVNQRPMLEITYTIVLPVEIADFKAVPTSTAVELSFELGEAFDGELVLEKAGASGEFEVMGGFVPGRRQKYFSTIDENPLDGVNHYRVKLVSANGEQAYSRVISTLWENKEAGLQVFPNPASEELNLAGYYPDHSSETGIVQLFDLAGRKHLDTTALLVDGKLAQRLELRAIESGIYFVRVTVGSQTEYRKIVVQ